MHETVAGAAIERPDYWVVRVSMLGMSKQEQGRLVGFLREQGEAEGTARVESIAAHARAAA